MFDRIITAASELARACGGSPDECRAYVPTWLYDQLEELVDGWFVVEEDKDLEPDEARVTHFVHGEAQMSEQVDLDPPALVAMGESVEA